MSCKPFKLSQPITFINFFFTCFLPITLKINIKCECFYILVLLKLLKAIHESATRRLEPQINIIEISKFLLLVFCLLACLTGCLSVCLLNTILHSNFKKIDLSMRKCAQVSVQFVLEIAIGKEKFGRQSSTSQIWTLMLKNLRTHSVFIASTCFVLNLVVDIPEFHCRAR